MLGAPTGVARMVPTALVDDRELHDRVDNHGHPASAYAIAAVPLPGRRPASSVCGPSGLRAWHSM